MTMITGTLINGAGQPIGNCMITIIAVQTSTKVITQTIGAYTTDATGAYHIDVPAGRYQIMLSTNGYPPIEAGIIQIFADSTSGSLNDFLLAVTEDDLTPPTIKHFEEILAIVEQQAKQVAELASQTQKSARDSENSAQNSQKQASLAKEMADWVKMSVEDLHAQEDIIQQTLQNLLQDSKQQANVATQAAQAAENSQSVANQSEQQATAAAAQSTQSAKEAQASATQAKESADKAAGQLPNILIDPDPNNILTSSSMGLYVSRNRTGQLGSGFTAVVTDSPAFTVKNGQWHYHIALLLDKIPARYPGIILLKADLAEVPCDNTGAPIPYTLSVNEISKKVGSAFRKHAAIYLIIQGIPTHQINPTTGQVSALDNFHQFHLSLRYVFADV